MTPQTIRSLQIAQRSKYFQRVNMGEFIKITGLKRLAYMALRLSSVIEAGRQLLFGKPRGRPRIYTNIAIVITELLRAAWNLSDEKIIQRFYDNPEYALTAGYPQNSQGQLEIINPAHFGRRRNQISAFPFVLCFILLAQHLIKHQIISLKDIIIDATTIWAANAKDTEARYCRYKKVFGYKLHLIIDRMSMLPVMFGITPAHRNDCVMAVPLLLLMLLCYGIKPLIVRADACYDTLDIRLFIRFILNGLAVIPKNFRKTGARKKLADYLQAQLFRFINAPRSAVERVFGLLKQHQKLENHNLIGWNKITRHCATKLTSMLLVALAAHKIRKPQLALSPAKILAHT